MIGKIKHHVLAFGDKFIVVEFAIALVIVAYLMIFFADATQIMLAVACFGIALNCLPMIAYGVQAIVNPQAQTVLPLDQKQTLRETLILSGALMVPFFLLAATTYELYTSAKFRKNK